MEKFVYFTGEERTENETVWTDESKKEHGDTRKNNGRRKRKKEIMKLRRLKNKNN